MLELDVELLEDVLDNELTLEELLEDWLELLLLELGDDELDSSTNSGSCNAPAVVHRTVEDTADTGFQAPPRNHTTGTAI